MNRLCKACLLILLLSCAGTSLAQNANPPNSQPAGQELVVKDPEKSEIARIIEKPQPTSTKTALRNKTTGTVILRCVFTSKGKVEHIQVVSGLPDGLTKSAILAAKQIRFTPATKNGRPVSMWMQLEYTFELN